MAFEVHREPLYRRYYANNTSGACCYAIVFGFILIFLPLIIAYNSSLFWIKENIIFEQPKVVYKYKTLVALHGTSGGEPLDIYYSTSDTINQLYNNNLRLPIVSSGELDDNRDGKMDRLEYSIVFPVSNDEVINSFNAVFFYEVSTNEKAKYVYEGISYINYESYSNIGKLDIDGDLILKQTWPLAVKGGYKVPYLHEPLLEIKDDLQSKEASIPYILAKAAARNLTLLFQPTYQYAVRNSYSSTDRTIQYFNCSIVQRIPEQGIRYTPPPSEVLKFAWIQYISFFAVISFMLFRLNSFVYRHQLLHTYSVADIVYEKLD